MGKELSLARQKEEGWTELLARVSNRVYQSEPSDRDQRKKKSSVTRWYKTAAAKGIKAKSKNSRKAKGTDGVSSESARCRRDNKNRKQDRRDEGEDTPIRRSASGLGIVFPGSFCDELSTRLIPHYWAETDKIDEGALFRCKKCHRYLWLPSWSGAELLGNIMDKYGLNEGYCKYLSHPSRRDAKILLAKLQRLDRLSETITDKIEFARLADKILNKKNYDRR